MKKYLIYFAFFAPLSIAAQSCNIETENVEAWLTENGETWQIECPNKIKNLQNTVFVYPNPTDFEINIDVQGFESVHIYDITGRLVMATNTAKIDISNLDTGYYFLHIKANKKVFYNKILKI